MNEGKAPTSARPVALIIGVVGLVVVVAIWYLAFFSVQTKHLNALRARQTQLVAEQSALSAKLASLQAGRRQEAQRLALLARYVDAIPPSADMASFIDQLDALATLTGASIRSITPGVPTAASKQAFSTIPVGLSTTGNYQETLSFLQGLYSLQRLVVVDSLSTSGGGQGGTASAGTASAGQAASQPGSLATTFSIRAFTTAQPSSPSVPGS